jgi:hypothetical protein
MTTRRDFMRAAGASVLFCSCGLLDAVHAQTPGGNRQRVTIKGRSSLAAEARGPRRGVRFPQ